MTDTLDTEAIRARLEAYERDGGLTWDADTLAATAFVLNATTDLRNCLQDLDFKSAEIARLRTVAGEMAGALEGAQEVINAAYQRGLSEARDFDEAANRNTTAEARWEAQRDAVLTKYKAYKDQTDD